MNEDVKLLLDGLKFCRSHEFCDGCPLEKKCLDKDSDFDIVGASADQIEALAAETEVVLSKLETTTRERDALKEDIQRAQDKAYDMQTGLLDNDVHQTCDYGLYCALCDALGDVVAWEHKELLDTTPELPKEDGT